MSDQATRIRDLALALRQVRSLVVLTGAGVSAESGVPTFREATTGLWAKYDPMTLASPEAFRKNPLRVWNWYVHRRRQLEQVVPNPGHFAVAELESLLPEVVVVTQNVDGLHRLAGSSQVWELHGSLYGMKRVTDDVPVRWEWPETLEDFAFTEETLPRCPQTGDLLRPDIVWFGEQLNPDVIASTVAAVQVADAVLVVGTSGTVYPAASLPREAMQRGIYTAEVNPVETPFSPHVDTWIAAPSGEALPQVVDALRQELS